MTGFEHALPEIKCGIRWRRKAWRRGKSVALTDPGNVRFGLMSFIALFLPDGGHAPWTPTRCDLLESDWERADGT